MHSLCLLTLAQLISNSAQYCCGYRGLFDLLKSVIPSQFSRSHKVWLCPDPEPTVSQRFISIPTSSTQSLWTSPSSSLSGSQFCSWCQWHRLSPAEGMHLSTEVVFTLGHFNLPWEERPAPPVIIFHISYQIQLLRGSKRVNV